MKIAGVTAELTRNCMSKEQAGSKIEGLPQAFVVGGRILVLFMALLLAVTPWTERYWKFDNFPRGGQDLELSLLTYLSLLCLMLLIAQRCKHGMTMLLSIQGWLFSMFGEAKSTRPEVLYGATLSFHTLPLPSPSLRVYSPPLQI